MQSSLNEGYQTFMEIHAIYHQALIDDVDVEESQMYFDASRRLQELCCSVVS